MRMLSRGGPNPLSVHTSYSLLTAPHSSVFLKVTCFLYLSSQDLFHVPMSTPEVSQRAPVYGQHKDIAVLPLHCFKWHIHVHVLYVLIVYSGVNPSPTWSIDWLVHCSAFFFLMIGINVCWFVWFFFVQIWLIQTFLHWHWCSIKSIKQLPTKVIK